MTTPRDPMKSFRGIMAGTLVLEVIVVALALPVVAKLGGGIGTARGIVVVAFIVALVVTCALLRYRWSIGVIIGLHAAMIAAWLALHALGVIGVIFSLVWAYLLWLRRDMLKRIAEGRLPSQQQP